MMTRLPMLRDVACKNGRTTTASLELFRAVAIPIGVVYTPGRTPLCRELTLNDSSLQELVSLAVVPSPDRAPRAKLPTETEKDPTRGDAVLRGARSSD